MTTEENDQDTLQLLDETDHDWVKRWRNAANGNKQAESESTFIVLPHEKTVPNEKTKRKK